MTQAKDKAAFNAHKQIIKSALPQESVCPYCNSVMEKDTKSPYRLVSIDHIIPYSHGGDDSLGNLKACCANCNTKRGNYVSPLGFKLSQVKKLTDTEYMALNEFVTISQRIEVLQTIKALLLEQKLSDAVAVSLDAARTTSSPSFFNKLTQGMKNNTNYDFVIKEVVVRLKAELDKMSVIKEQVSHLQFSLYRME